MTNQIPNPKSQFGHLVISPLDWALSPFGRSPAGREFGHWDFGPFLDLSSNFCYNYCVLGKAVTRNQKLKLNAHEEF